MSAMDMDMDMDMDMNNTDMDMSGYMMKMWFHDGTNEIILFRSWYITDAGGMTYSFFVLFLAAFLYEGLKYFRNNLYARQLKTQSSQNITSLVSQTLGKDDGSSPHGWISGMFNTMHAVQTLLHAVQFFVSYLLMLVFMTYNVWLCLAVVLGAAVGFFVFGWQNSGVDMTEHCH